MIKRKYIEMVKNRVDIQDLFENHFNIKLKKAGTKLRGICPFHDDHTPSLNIDPNLNLFYCPVCNAGGDVITAVMEKEGWDFDASVKWLVFQYCEEVNAGELEKKMTPQEEEEAKRRETMFIYNQYAQDWFSKQLWAETPDAKSARNYAIRPEALPKELDEYGTEKPKRGRWSEQYARMAGIGFCPAGTDRDEFVQYARKIGLKMDILENLGLVAKSNRGDGYYDKYSGRITIPQISRYNKIETFTCRDITGKAEAKYLNGKDCEIYTKKTTVFGLNIALKQARQKEKIYLLEGAPDVMRLQSLGIANAIASLGGNWSEEQFRMIESFHPTICFIPDADVAKDPAQLPPGKRFVVENGKKAIAMGFNVTVREIPDEAHEKNRKEDADSYLTDISKWHDMSEKDFIPWFAAIKYDDNATRQEQLKAIAEICDLLILIQNETQRKVFLEDLIERYKQGNAWKSSLKEAAERLQQEIRREEIKNNGIDECENYGFHEDKGRNKYYGISQNGKPTDWTNFLMKPLFHIIDDVNPKRMFEMKNGSGVTRIIELKQSEITQMSPFKQYIEGQGNFMVYCDPKQYDKLRTFWYSKTETATEIKQLGWQDEGEDGFFAFCNGIIHLGKWIQIDDYGIVRLEKENFYLPAMSKIYFGSRELFHNERKFIHDPQREFPLYDYFKQISEVFGDNGKVALCFYMATLFRDVIKAKLRFFPILNIYGKKGTGKTELAVTLTSFFMSETEPTNIESTTVPAMADKVGAYSNAVVHLDEYKNSIHPFKMDFLKGIWDSAGRTRMNMDRDKKRESTPVDCGVVITGQEIPNADIALFTRVIHLASQKSEHTADQKKKYNDLMAMRKMGATHITVEILKHRESFEAGWAESWRRASERVNDLVIQEGLQDRIINNWTVMLATVMCLKDNLHLPFSVDDIFDIIIEGMRAQNCTCDSNDELAEFWSMVSKARAACDIIEQQDYKIVATKELRLLKGGKKLTFMPPKKILYMRLDLCISKAAQQARKEGKSLIDVSSLMGYITSSPEYMGQTNSALTFSKFDKNGNKRQIPVLQDGIATGFMEEKDKVRAIAFDYEAICEKYDISLSSVFVNSLARDDSDGENSFV